MPQSKQTSLKKKLVSIKVLEWPMYDGTFDILLTWVYPVIILM